MSRRNEEDMDQLLSDLRVELRKPRTMIHLTGRFKVSRVTMFRWFKRLAAAGTSPSRVGIDRPTHYQIAS